MLAFSEAVIGLILIALLIAYLPTMYGAFSRREAALCLRAGYLALRHVADYFRIPHNAVPTDLEPISVSRDEFDQAYDQLAAAGIPVLADRDRCWRGFRGWRVNYDTVLLALAAITMAPFAPWSSDRSLLPVRALFFADPFFAIGGAGLTWPRCGVPAARRAMAASTARLKFVDGFL